MKMSQNDSSRKDVRSAEDTLRLIAGLPSPEGLVDRVQMRLRTEPRQSRILFWPRVAGSYGSVLRGAAAAAIVGVVAGGGWQIYTRVKPGPDAHVLRMPMPIAPARGFSIGGSVHTPDPRSAPILTRPPLAGRTSNETRPQDTGQSGRTQIDPKLAESLKARNRPSN